MPESNAIEFEVQAQQTQSPIQLGVSGGSGSVGLDATMINDIMVGLIERCVAHQYDPNYYYYKYDYVIYQHRLWQYITDHVPGDFNEAEVRLMTLADDVKLLYDTLIRETVFVGSSEWSHTSNYYKKKISGKYQPGKKLYISTPCENPEAYIAITYHRDFPTPVGGMSENFTEEEHPNGDLNGYSFTLYDGTYNNIIDYYTIKAYGFTAEEIANTYIYSRDIKNDLIADEFSDSKTYKAGEYTIHLGELVRFIGKNHSAGSFAPDLAENVTVGQELTSILKLICNAFEITVFPLVTNNDYAILECEKLYWQPGMDYLVMWPRLIPVDPDDPDPPSENIMITTDETGVDENGNTVYVHNDLAGISSDANHISIWEYLNGKFASANGNASTRIPLSQKGAANGVAELDSNGLIPAAQLPSYVDDVVEGYLYNGVFYAESAHTTALTGMSGKIYVDLTSGSRKVYRWSGSVYAEIPIGLALGESSADAFRGDHGKVAYDHAVAKGSAFESGLYKITTNSEGHVTGATPVSAADIRGISGIDATGSVNGLMSSTDKALIDALGLSIDSSGYICQTV